MKVSQAISTGIAVVVLLVVVISASTGAVWVSRNSGAQSTNNAGGSSLTTISSSVIQNFVSGPGCQALTPSGLSLVKTTANNSISLLGFAMKSGSQATVCVSYKLDNNSVSMLPFTVNFYMLVYQVNATPVPQNGQTGYIYSVSNASGFTATANPSALTIPAGFSATQIITVNYTITASSSTRGFFSLVYYNHCPSYIPLSVGFGSAQISASNYQGYFIPSGCPENPPLKIGSITGYGGLGAMWLG